MTQEKDFEIAQSLRERNQHLSDEEFLRKYFWIEYNTVFSRAYKAGSEQ